jgi:osmotically inducible lipoprotein OsmB
MKRIVAGLAVLALAGACGTTNSQRGLSGAALGAGFGALGGGVGVLAGAAIGAGIGMLTDRDTLYLGEPIWE